MSEPLWKLEANSISRNHVSGEYWGGINQALGALDHQIRILHDRITKLEKQCSKCEVYKTILVGERLEDATGS